jgi:hypothetical protein
MKKLMSLLSRRELLRSIMRPLQTSLAYLADQLVLSGSW